MRLTPEQRTKLDTDVLRAATEWSGGATYVLRNRLDWPGKSWHRKNLQTSDVLRSCRRLEAKGLIEREPTSYAVMLSWRTTEAGRRALSCKNSD